MPDPKGKSHICVDFDGVIHSYSSGWKGATVIPDAPVPGALKWLVMMVGLPDFQICIYSSRSKEPEAIKAMQEWLNRYLIVFFHDLAFPYKAAYEVMAKLEFPTQKPAANMMIDDRGFCFQGTFPTPEWLRDFKPWNKRVVEVKGGITIGFDSLGRVAYEAQARARDSLPFAPWNSLTTEERHVWCVTAAAVTAGRTSKSVAERIDILPDPTTVPAELISDIYREAWSGSAEAMYNAYGASVNWKAVSGHPMPAWKDLPPRISGAWCVAAEAALDHNGVGKSL